MNDNCICAEWDGEGWSTCGFPCPEHITTTKLSEGIRGTEEYIKLNAEPAEPVAKAILDHMKSRLVMLKDYQRSHMLP
jgi:hypothetical protein